MYLGIDLVTSGLRMLLVDEQGQVLGEAESHYAVQQPHTGWSEQNPEDWLTAIQTAIYQLKQAYPQAFSAIRGIGLSGQMHGAVLLGEQDQVLRPCMLWNDTRATQEASILDSYEAMRAISGNIVFPGFTAPKLLWVRAHEPEIFAQVAKVLLPKDYLRLWLTGEHVSDMSDSAGTAWLDVAQRDWSEKLLTLGGMTLGQMPRLVEGTDIAGYLRPELQMEWGLQKSILVAGGGGDNAVAACGVGCVDEGDGFVSLGTSGVLLAAKADYAPKPASVVHTFCHALPDTWYQMGVTLAATDCLNWLGRQTGQLPAAMAMALPEKPTGPSSVTFLPYLSGERTPHNSSSIRGSFVGLDIADGPAVLTQAVMEGVACSLADCLLALQSTGTHLHKVLAIGGGTQSMFWCKTLANVMNLSIILPSRGELGAALGAARLAMLAEDPKASVLSKPTIRCTIDPNPNLTEAYADALAYYRQLFPKLHKVE